MNYYIVQLGVVFDHGEEHTGEYAIVEVPVNYAPGEHEHIIGKKLRLLAEQVFWQTVYDELFYNTPIIHTWSLGYREMEPENV